MIQRCDAGLVNRARSVVVRVVGPVRCQLRSILAPCQQAGIDVVAGLRGVVGGVGCGNWEALGFVIGSAALDIFAVCTLHSCLGDVSGVVIAVGSCYVVAADRLGVAGVVVSIGQPGNIQLILKRSFAARYALLVVSAKSSLRCSTFAIGVSSLSFCL